MHRLGYRKFPASFHLLITCLIAATVGMSSAAAGERPATPRGSLLTEAPLPEAVTLPDEEKIVRTRPVHVRLDLLDDLAVNDSVELAFFDDAVYTAVFERFNPRSEHSYTWRGSLVEENEGGWFIVAVHDGVMVANFWTADGDAFEIRPAGEGLPVYFASELELALFPECAVCRAQHVGRQVGLENRLPQGEPQPIGGGDSGDCGNDDGSLIDVMVVYTPAARHAVGGTSAMIALIDAAVEATNTAYENSEVETRVRLVYQAETDYTESGSFGTDLSRLRIQGNGYMDEVHPLRDQYGADLVALISNGTGACGIAHLMTNLSPGFEAWAFSVTRHSCAVGNLTFAHELGHNMGCAHDHDNAGNALFSYSYGHRWHTTWGAQRRSVMAYAPGTRVPHFSNPDVLNGGTPTGIHPGQPQPAHNALSINNAAYTVANFRPSVCPPPLNDTCENTFVVGEGVHSFHNINASTSGPDEPEHCTFFGDSHLQSDVWFGHVAKCTGELTVSLCGSSFATKLALYDFPCPTASGSVMACNAGACGQQSEITIPVVENQAIRIRIGGYHGAQGEGILTITCEPEPDCHGDLTGSGVVDVSDLLQMLGAWGPCVDPDDCPEDLNGDGVVDVSDLLDLLGAWGPCE